MEKKGWREELKILLEREEEEILLAERVAKPYSGKRREDIYNFVEKEIEKAREEVQFTKEELECILKWKDACDGEFNGMTLLPASGEDWGKEEDIENAEDKLEEMLSKLKDNK